MAEKKDLDYSYTTIDEIFRLSLGESADFSGAKYDGVFTLSLEEAQRAKHNYIAEGLGIKKGDKVLDMGCGWGPFSKYIQEKGAKSIGLTLSQGQAEACRRNGLEVYVRDCRKVTPEEFGTFDAISCVGAFEHFCSVEDWKEGKQEATYHDFFQTAFNLLPIGGRMYLQTMVFGSNRVPYEEIDINAPVGSPAHIMGLMLKQFPGSWLPYDLDMVVRTAKPYFKLVSQSNGRLDYIETIGQWRKKFRRFQLKKYWLYLKLLPQYLKDREFRHRVAVFRISPNRVCFEQNIMDHYRLVFEKT
jgi:cyclopropane-fatty-acyl-phospholipid synthase